MQTVVRRPPARHALPLCFLRFRCVAHARRPALVCAVACVVEVRPPALGSMSPRTVRSSHLTAPGTSRAHETYAEDNHDDALAPQRESAPSPARRPSSTWPTWHAAREDPALPREFAARSALLLLYRPRFPRLASDGRREPTSVPVPTGVDSRSRRRTCSRARRARLLPLLHVVRRRSVPRGKCEGCNLTSGTVTTGPLTNARGVSFVRRLDLGPVGQVASYVEFMGTPTPGTRCGACRRRFFAEEATIIASCATAKARLPPPTHDRPAATSRPTAPPPWLLDMTPYCRPRALGGQPPRADPSPLNRLAVVGHAARVCWYWRSERRRRRHLGPDRPPPVPHWGPGKVVRIEGGGAKRCKIEKQDGGALRRSVATVRRPRF